MFIQIEIITGTLYGEEVTRKIWVNTAQVCTVNGDVVKMSNQDIVTLTSDSLRDLLTSITPKEKQVKDNAPKKELLDLFNKLHILTKGKGKPVFSLTREKKLNDLLTKHRMTEEQLIKAATSVGNDKFLQGDNDRKKRYGDIDYLLRPDKAAKYADADIKDDKRKMF